MSSAVGTSIANGHSSIPCAHDLAFAQVRERGHDNVMMQTIEAVIDQRGGVRLLEPVHLETPKRALVTILEEAPEPNESALLSEVALAADWNRAEEDQAWAHLQPAKSS
jgi:hypothetical protein